MCEFSVLIPVYNAQDYLEDCVRSVLEQTFQDFEIILVNDGSRDGSGDLCDRLAQTDPRIKAFHKANGGQLHTRLAAMQQACGRYYVFLDADDTLKKHALETILETFRRTGSDCVIYGMERVCGGEILQKMVDEREEIVSDKRTLYRRCFSTSAYNSMCRKAVKASVCPEEDYSAFFHLRHAEDLMQSIAILKNCEKVVFLPQVLYNYTYNPTSVTQSLTFENYRVDFTVRNFLLRFLQEENVFDKDDFSVCRTGGIRLLIFEIRKISGIKTTRKNKKALLKQLRNNEYYRNFLNAGAYSAKALGKDVLLFWLLKYRLDSLLLILLSA